MFYLELHFTSDYIYLLFKQENRNDTEILGDVEEVNSSPRLESQQGQFEGDSSLVIDVESTVKPEGPDKMVTDNECM